MNMTEKDVFSGIIFGMILFWICIKWIDYECISKRLYKLLLFYVPLMMWLLCNICFEIGIDWFWDCIESFRLNNYLIELNCWEINCNRTSDGVLLFYFLRHLLSRCWHCWINHFLCCLRFASGRRWVCLCLEEGLRRNPSWNL